MPPKTTSERVDGLAYWILQLIIKGSAGVRWSWLSQILRETYMYMTCVLRDAIYIAEWFSCQWFAIYQVSHPHYNNNHGNTARVDNMEKRVLRNLFQYNVAVLPV